MIAEKQVTVKIFDMEKLKPGTKITCKHRSYISSYEIEENINIIKGKVLNCSEKYLTVESMYAQYGIKIIKKISLEDVINGFWTLELL